MTQDCLDTPLRPLAVATPSTPSPLPGAVDPAAPLTPDAVSDPSARRVHHARADCTADADGGLTFEVRLFDAEAREIGAGELPGSAAVLLRLRQESGPEATVRLPLARVAATDRLRAILAGTALVREGRWDAYLDLGEDEPQRLLPGVHDLRVLSGDVPPHVHAWLGGVRVPYTTKHGNLTVRTWLRRPHAEAGALRVTDGVLGLQGSLYGVRLTATACLEAQPRDTAASPVRVPVRASGEDGSAPAADGRHPQRGFTAELPLEALLPGEDVWDLWLRPAEGEEPVRLARILDDVLDKKRVFSYPAQRVTSPEGTVHAAGPYYTINNNLSVRVREESSA